MKNIYLKFYGEHKISPVHTNMNNWDKHVENRKNLYRQLGIPMQCFKDKSLLEFGPGGGYNSLPLLTVGKAAHIDMVEPNETGRNEIIELFESNHIEKSRYRLYSCILEEYETEQKYDMIMAEQFLPHLENWNECLEKIKTFAKPGTIVIVTASDEIGFYIERMKRLVGRFMIRDIKEYDEQVKELVAIFSKQLDTMSNMTRPYKDWVEDQFMNEIAICGYLMTLKDVMNVFAGEFDVLGTSQCIFTDYSWYKDIDYDYIAEYMEQYDRKKHMFLLTDDHHETIRTKEENDRLEAAVSSANRIAAESELSGDYKIEELCAAIDEVTEATDNEKVKIFNQQQIQILRAVQSGAPVDLSEYEIWGRCFGRTSQFISLVKR